MKSFLNYTKEVFIDTKINLLTWLIIMFVIMLTTK